MKHYELLSIIPLKFTDEEIAGIGQRISDIIAGAGGSVVSATLLTKTKLAYGIDHNKNAAFYLTQFDIEPTKVEELRKLLSIRSEVIRFDISVVDAHGTPRMTTGWMRREEKPEDYAPGTESVHKDAVVADASPVANQEASSEVAPAEDTLAKLDEKLDEILTTGA